MKSKIPFTLILIGVIIGFLKSLWTIISITFFQGFTEIFGDFLQGPEGDIFSLILGAVFLISLIAAIIGLIFSLILTYCVVKIYRQPAKVYFIVAIVLGALGIFLGMGLIAGILVVVGAIVGLTDLKKPGEATKAKKR